MEILKSQNEVEPILDCLVEHHWHAVEHITTHHEESRNTHEIIGKLCIYMITILLHYWYFNIANKNIFIFYRCSCSDGYRCVLTKNLTDRRVYIFQCRENEESMRENMTLFPTDAVSYYGWNTPSAIISMISLHLKS